ncbi:MAG: HNH endonuclease signature motif containing protein [Reichenbachiella sp.]|uniref:HNH endonuclease n=1 Tax=Reichenbachiella sp. TaxID=2184521 RepID=UPI0032970D2A
MGNKIFDFLKGDTANWIEERTLKKLKNNSVFNFHTIENIDWNKIKKLENRYLYQDNENHFYMFAYKSKYGTIHWNGLPKYHITQCRTREQYSGFQFANKMPVGIYCTDQKSDLGPQRLSFCRNCNRELNFFSFGTNDKDWHQVIIDIANKKSSSGYDVLEIRNDGYTRDWQQVSYAIRANMNFTCESCNIKLLDDDAFFLEVHHVNKNRLDNHKSNLKSLCVECHSKVDDSHVKNYGSGENFLKLISFQNRFRN